MSAEIEIIGLKELQNAVNRNPRKVLSEARSFLTRGLAAYKRGIIRSPWRMGGGGGGAPVASVNGGNLRDTHQTQVTNLEGRIFPTASYAPYVHGIAGWPRKRTYQLRPWLDYVKQDKDSEITTLYRQMLQSIVSDLAK